MAKMKKSATRMCEMLEHVLFTLGYWVFWCIWNLLGLKWLFRAAIAVIDRADQHDNEKILRRMRALNRAGEVV